MRIAHFTPEQRATMLDLRRACSGRTIVLIGASALGCWLEMRWRRTNDLDLTVVADQGELREMLRARSWEPDSRHEQRWVSPHGVTVDLLPASAANLARGEILFSQSGRTMNLAGFDLAIKQNVLLELEEGAAVAVATVPVIVVLKMAAWLDRPSERDRDLEDIAHVFNEYLDPSDLRRWDESMLETNLDFEEQGAFVLGRELAGIIDGHHRKVIASFVGKAAVEESAHHAHFARHFRPSEDPSRLLLGCLRALELGLREIPH